MVDISATDKEKELPPPSKKVSKRASRGSYRNWNEGIYKTAMDDAVKSMLVSGGNVTIALETASMDIPQSLLSRDRRAKKMIEEGKDEKHIEDEDNLAIFNRKEKSDQWSERKRGPLPLIGTETRDLLQDVACARDNCNNVLQRKEMICMILEFSGVSLKTAENHYGHLIRSKQLRKW